MMLLFGPAFRKSRAAGLAGSDRIMFDSTDRDRTAALAEMRRQARARSNFNSNEARQKMAEWIANDRRFDGYDPAKLVDRVEHCVANAAQFDVNAPELKKGGKSVDAWNRPPVSGR